MSRINITEVGPVAKDGKFTHFTIKYTDKGKDFSKKLLSFGGPAYEALKNAKPGEEYDVEVKKNDNGFWEWVSVTAATGAPTQQAGPKGGGSYDKVQTYIIRQNSVTNAVNFVNSRGGAVVTDVLDIAAAFEAWVTRD